MIGALLSETTYLYIHNIYPHSHMVNGGSDRNKPRNKHSLYYILYKRPHVIKHLYKIYYTVRIMSDAETSQPKRLKLSQDEEQADSEQIYSPYYTANLQFILNSVLSKDSVDKNALKEDEICSILELKQLEGKVYLTH